MAVLGAIREAFTGILKPVADIIDNLHVAEDEKAEARAKLVEAQAKLESKASEIVESEAQHEHWYVAGWRPTYMYVFLAIVLAHTAGWIEHELAPEMWDLMKFGLTGYIGARGLEKVAKTLKGRL